MDANTMGSQSVHSILWHIWQKRPEDDKSIVETRSLIITLSNKVNCADVHYLILYYYYN